jgi:hypothetical protein
MGCVELCSIEFYLVLLSSIFSRFNSFVFLGVFALWVSSFFYRCTFKDFPSRPAIAETWEAKFETPIHPRK